MRILITNDDGYRARGIQSLIKAVRPLGELTVIAPKTVQSGMSMAVTMGYKPIAVKHLKTLPGEDWWYLDGTPASCIKFGIDNILHPLKPDLVISGINHGSNAATASNYSGTVGAAMEGAINGIPSIAVSLDDFSHDADFSAVEQILPGILEKLIPNFSPRFGTSYNINFPNLPADKIKGVKAARMGIIHWEKEYLPYGKDFLDSRGHTPSTSDLEYVKAALPGEDFYVMAGDIVENPGNLPDADHRLMSEGFVVVTPLNLDHTDTTELDRLCAII
ncbi:MAG: 5'/3'-nucleotidase SurE [Bacteroidales bacterium]|nr:5'/3'-nucleotidase SurE [Bacteroidales bacterium]